MSSYTIPMALDVEANEYDKRFYLEREYKEIVKMFPTELTPVVLCWTNRLSKAMGRCIARHGDTHALRIELSLKHLRINRASDYVDVLLHEVAHALDFYRTHTLGHGATFQSCIRELPIREGFDQCMAPAHMASLPRRRRIHRRKISY